MKAYNPPATQATLVLLFFYYGRYESAVGSLTPLSISKALLFASVLAYLSVANRYVIPCERHAHPLSKYLVSVCTCFFLSIIFLEIMVFFKKIRCQGAIKYLKGRVYVRVPQALLIYSDQVMYEHMKIVRASTLEVLRMPKR